MKLNRKSVGWIRPSTLTSQARESAGQEIARCLLLQIYAPPSVLIDTNCECIGFFGQIQLYLAIPSKAENSKLFTIAHEGVRSRLREALKFAWFDDGADNTDAGDLEKNERFDSLAIGVLPVQTAHETLLLVSFLDRPNSFEHRHARTICGSAARPIGVPETSQPCGSATHLEGLSPRQRAVLNLVANGRSNKQIAGDLGISHRTVETHRVIVMRKLGARNFADLMRLVSKV
jgi:DNA-binding CsgD family transcriptional regulator